MSDQPKCELCGEPMPAGEEMFKYHGFSGPCPTAETKINCKLDMSHCQHEFTETGDPDQDHCTKCGQSVWAWAFMEMP